MDTKRRTTLLLAALGIPFAMLPIGRAKEETRTVNLYADGALAAYGFPDGHPLGIDRQAAFLAEAEAQGLLSRAVRGNSRDAAREELELFHTADYIEYVFQAEGRGIRVLDGGDTPVFPGVYEASAHVVGAALDGLRQIMEGNCAHTLQPIGGLHHAARDGAAGFCVFNDLGIVVEALRREYGISRVGYVDIDVHHGDGVFYAFENDPELIFADVHQHSKTLYPGTGRTDEVGKGSARGTKLNIELLPGAGDHEFAEVWPQVEGHFKKHRPEFYIFQCGADGLEGDSLASLRYSEKTHALAARQLIALANDHAKGRIMAFGGGGYNRTNLAKAWNAVLRELLLS